MIVFWFSDINVEFNRKSESFRSHIMYLSIKLNSHVPREQTGDVVKQKRVHYKLVREASTGFGPVMRVLQTLALPLGHDADKKSGRWDSNPRPSPWQGDVLPLNHARKSWPLLLAESAETQDRTGDTAIFSRVLYQLSYLG
jgi:hypothetical protein